MLAEYGKAHRNQPTEQGRMVSVKHEPIRWKQTSANGGSQGGCKPVPQIVPPNDAIDSTGPAQLAPPAGNKIVRPSLREVVEPYEKSQEEDPDEEKWGNVPMGCQGYSFKASRQ